MVLSFPQFGVHSLRMQLLPESDVAAAFDVLDYGEEMTFNQTK